MAFRPYRVAGWRVWLFGGVAGWRVEGVAGWRGCGVAWLWGGARVVPLDPV